MWRRLSFFIFLNPPFFIEGIRILFFPGLSKNENIRKNGSIEHFRTETLLLICEVFKFIDSNSKVPKGTYYETLRGFLGRTLYNWFIFLYYIFGVSFFTSVHVYIERVTIYVEPKGPRKSYKKVKKSEKKKPKPVKLNQHDTRR